MASLAKNRPLKKRHVEFQPGTPKVIINNQAEQPPFLPDITVSDLGHDHERAVSTLEPLDFHVHEEDAAALLGDISTTCLADTVAIPAQVVGSSNTNSMLFDDLIEVSQRSLLTAPITAAAAAKCEQMRPGCAVLTQPPAISLIRKCIGCPYLAKTSRDLKEHYKVCTSEVFGPSTAVETVKTEALKTLKRKKSDNNKKKKPSDQELFECDHCQFYSRSFRAFTMHLRSHSGQVATSSPLTKQACPKCGVFVFNLRNHAIKQHARADASSKSFVCPTCGYLANSPRQLKQHTQAKHRTGSKSYRCKICSKEYAYLPSLYRHQLQHSADRDRLYPRVCPTCGARFRSRNALDAHVISRHTADRPFACDECPKRFATRSLLSQHKIVHSTDDGDASSLQVHLKCDECQREFKRAGDLRKHVSSVHKGDKKFPCRTGCDKRFADSSSRKRHERTHTGEKPFACKQCPMRFCQSSGLSSHVKTKHNSDYATTIQAKKRRKSSSKTADVQPILQVSAQEQTTQPVVSSGGFVDSSAFNILSSHGMPGPLLANESHPLHHFDFVFGNELGELVLDKVASVDITAHSESMLWQQTGSEHHHFAFPPSSHHSESQMLVNTASCSTTTNSSHFYPALPVTTVSTTSAALPLQQTSAPSDERHDESVVTTRSVQALACDSGVLDVLHELVAAGRLEHCPYCSYLASSSDALCQHMQCHQHHNDSQVLQLNHL